MYALAPDIYDSASSLKTRGPSYKLARSRTALYSTYSFSPPERAPSRATSLSFKPYSAATGGGCSTSSTTCQQAGTSSTENDVEAYDAGDHLMLTSFESAPHDVPSRPEERGSVLPDGEVMTWTGSRT